jgi:hypothetical protein
MNALFGRVIKVFLALHKAQDALGQDHGYGAQRGDGRLPMRIRWHAQSFR